MYELWVLNFSSSWTLTTSVDICGLGLVPDRRFDCGTIPNIYEQLLISTRDSHLGVMSTTPALHTITNKSWHTVMFSDQRWSDSICVNVADYVADMNINPVASQLAKTKSGKQMKLNSSPLLPSLLVLPSSPLPPLLPLTPLPSPTTVNNWPTYNSLSQAVFMTPSFWTGTGPDK